MRKGLLAFGILGTFGVILFAVASRPPQERRVPGQEEALRETSAAQDPSPGENPEGQVVAALRMQLKQKDALIASLVATKLRETNTGASGDQEDRPDPRRAAMRVLDERMAQGSATSSDARQMQEAVRTVLAGGTLANTATTDLRCGGRLCRLVISDETHDKVEREAQRISESVAKAVGGIVVLEGKEGERIMYLARSSQDLRIAPPTEPDDLQGEEPAKAESGRQTL